MKCSISQMSPNQITLRPLVPWYSIIQRSTLEIKIACFLDSLLTLSLVASIPIFISMFPVLIPLKSIIRFCFALPITIPISGPRKFSDLRSYREHNRFMVANGGFLFKIFINYFGMINAFLRFLEGERNLQCQTTSKVPISTVHLSWPRCLILIYNKRYPKKNKNYLLTNIKDSID